jgi:hypothetical protein
VNSATPRGARQCRSSVGSGRPGWPFLGPQPWWRRPDSTNRSILAPVAGSVRRAYSAASGPTRIEVTAVEREARHEGARRRDADHLVLRPRGARRRLTGPQRHEILPDQCRRVDEAAQRCAARQPPPMQQRPVGVRCRRTFLNGSDERDLGYRPNESRPVKGRRARTRVAHIPYCAIGGGSPRRQARAAV